jgi:hypothetical protein
VEGVRQTAHSVIDEDDHHRHNATRSAKQQREIQNEIKKRIKKWIFCSKKNLIYFRRGRFGAFHFLGAVGAAAPVGCGAGAPAAVGAPALVPVVADLGMVGLPELMLVFVVVWSVLEGRGCGWVGGG